MLWDLQSDITCQYFNTWNTCIKLAWKVPRSTHRYFLDYLSGGLVSVRRDMLARYLGFYRSLLKSPCSEVRVLANIVAKDVRTTTARNLRLLEEETEGLTWVASNLRVKDMLIRGEPKVPESVKWRLPYLGKLLEQRDKLVYEGMEDSVEVVYVQSLIDSLCSS